MKMKSIFVSMFALAALASCSNDNDGLDNGPSIDTTPADAYLSLIIKTPHPALGTRAETDATLDGDPGNKEGSEDESAVKNALVVGLLNDKTIEVYEWDGAKSTIASDGYTYIGEAIGVSSKLDSVFVVANPSTLARQQIVAAHKSSSRAAVFKAIQEVVGNVTPKKGFMMVSTGSLNNGVWTKANVKEVTADLDATAAQDAAKTNPTLVDVDRVVAKATLSASVPTFVNGDGRIIGFQLNTTNKNYLPYADLIAYTTTSGTPAKYRIDANWTQLAMKADGTGAAADAFNWLKNNQTDDKNDNSSWKGNGATAYTETSDYCHENTMEAAAQDYNNTTKMVIKAFYTPTRTGLTKGDSWFRIDGTVMTFDEVDKSYGEATTSATDKLKYSAFLDKLLGTERTKGWTGEGKAAIVTLTDLDAVHNGGYKAATVDSVVNVVSGDKENAYLIEYYQKSNCYYDVNIKHDNRVAPKTLGRWGMVRNNWYTLTVNKISSAGKPYIPDPTDPDITDPTNPDPTKPTPDDDSAFIAVTITVNNWTTWSQGVDL